MQGPEVMNCHQTDQVSSLKGSSEIAAEGLLAQDFWYHFTEH